MNAWIRAEFSWDTGATVVAFEVKEGVVVYAAPFLRKLVARHKNDARALGAYLKRRGATLHRIDAKGATEIC